MKAVNLIPPESRRGSNVPSKSGGAVYGLLGVLGVAVLLVLAVTLVSRSVDERRATLASTSQQATALEAQAASLNDYTTFADLRAKRVQTVTALAKSRFDWSHSMHELARVLPSTVSLVAVTGTISNDVGVDGATANPLRAALPNPALAIAGCAKTQDDVAELVSRLRLMDGVTRVSLSSSKRPASPSTECQQGSALSPQFELVVFYEPVDGLVTKASAAAAAATPAADPAAAGTATTPAAGTATTATPAAGTATPSATPAASEVSR